MSIFSIIGLVLLFWSTITLLLAVYRKDGQHVIRAGLAAGISAFIVVIGYLAR